MSPWSQVVLWLSEYTRLTLNLEHSSFLCRLRAMAEVTDMDHHSWPDGRLVFEECLSEGCMRWSASSFQHEVGPKECSDFPVSKTCFLWIRLGPFPDCSQHSESPQACLGYLGYALFENALYFYPKINIKETISGWGFGSEFEHLPSNFKALGVVLKSRKERKKERKKRPQCNLSSLPTCVNLSN